MSMDSNRSWSTICEDVRRPGQPCSLPYQAPAVVSVGVVPSAAVALAHRTGSEAKPMLVMQSTMTASPHIRSALSAPNHNPSCSRVIGLGRVGSSFCAGVLQP